MSRPPVAAYETSTREPKDWRKQGACREHDPELFFPIGHTGPAIVQIEAAKTVCWTECAGEVRTACLKWATENRILDGVWGGTSERDREKMRRAEARVRLGRPRKGGES